MDNANAGLDGATASPELFAVASAVEPVRRTLADGNWGRYFVAFTDGSCRAAQGGERGPGGWGLVIFTARGDKMEAHGQLADTTSNRAEVSGLLAALIAVPTGSYLSVQSDSRYVVDHVRRWMRAADNEDLWTEVRELAVGKQVELRTTWVAGHNGHQHNERVDALASRSLARRRRRRS